MIMDMTSLSPSVLPIRRSTVWRGPAPPDTPTALRATQKRGSEAISPKGVLTGLTRVGTTEATGTESDAIFGAAVANASANIRSVEVVEDEGEFLLKDLDSLLDDVVWFETADGFDFEIEFGGEGVVGKWEGGGGGIFPGGVFGERPGLGLISYREGKTANWLEGGNLRKNGLETRFQAG